MQTPITFNGLCGWCPPAARVILAQFKKEIPVLVEEKSDWCLSWLPNLLRDHGSGFCPTNERLGTQTSFLATEPSYFLRNESKDTLKKEIIYRPLTVGSRNGLVSFIEKWLPYGVPRSVIVVSMRTWHTEKGKIWPAVEGPELAELLTRNIANDVLVTIFRIPQEVSKVPNPIDHCVTLDMEILLAFSEERKNNITRELEKLGNLFLLYTGFPPCIDSKFQLERGGAMRMPITVEVKGFSGTSLVSFRSKGDYVNFMVEGKNGEKILKLQSLCGTRSALEIILGTAFIKWNTARNMMDL